ncbi:PREDICTED: 39S ribosomal protein L45, mitochondrial [Tarenaya hassleriana]|uniref:39S ribosomal protein L45, mitochondrial n=1 Tax=Tarenaya hassleriana TaxID=28532 RepID=UPI00053C4A76|nr:PREDICTED: 39S ribosomal protein L45, mitochondrial [Tarenaya hassleriana]
MAFARRFQTVRALFRASEIRESSVLFGSSRSYLHRISQAPEPYGESSSFLYKRQNALSCPLGNTHMLRSTMAADKRSFAAQVNASPQLRKTSAVKFSMMSPGFVYEPYAIREPIPFWRRCFTRSGWERTKEDFLRQLRSAYAIAKLRKTGYSKNKFYLEALELYKEINILMANGDKKAIRKSVTERMYSTLKNEIKQREAVWGSVYWEMIEPANKIRTLQARLIGIDQKDMNKAFIQLTLEFLTKQKFEAYDSQGNVVAGDRNKEVLVRDVWVFEKSLFHTGAYWRLCGRLKV